MRVRYLVFHFTRRRAHLYSAFDLRRMYLISGHSLPLKRKYLTIQLTSCTGLLREQPTRVQGDAHFNCLNNVWQKLTPESGESVFDSIINSQKNSSWYPLKTPSTASTDMGIANDSNATCHKDRKFALMGDPPVLYEEAIVMLHPCSIQISHRSPSI